MTVEEFLLEMTGLVPYEKRRIKGHIAREDMARKLLLVVKADQERKQRMEVQLNAIHQQANRIKEYANYKPELKNMYDHAVNILAGVLLVEEELKEK